MVYAWCRLAFENLLRCPRVPSGAAWLKEPAVESFSGYQGETTSSCTVCSPATETRLHGVCSLCLGKCGCFSLRHFPFSYLKPNREAEGLFSPVAVKNLGDFTCLPPGSWPTHMQRDVICTWVGRPLLRLQEFSTVSTGFAPQFAAEGRACSICSKEIWADAATIQCMSWHGAGCDLEFRCPGKPVSR